MLLAVATVAALASAAMACSSGGLATGSVTAEMASEPAVTASTTTAVPATAPPSTSGKTPLGSAPKRTTTTTEPDDPTDTTTEPTDTTDTTDDPGDVDEAAVVKASLVVPDELPGPAALADHGYDTKGVVATAGRTMGFDKCPTSSDVRVLTSWSGPQYTTTTQDGSMYVSQINGIAEDDDAASAVVAAFSEKATQDCVVGQITASQKDTPFTTVPFTRPTPADEVAGVELHLVQATPAVVYIVLIREGRMVSVVFLGVKGPNDGGYVDAVLAIATGKLAAAL